MVILHNKRCREQSSVLAVQWGHHSSDLWSSQIGLFPELFTQWLHPQQCRETSATLSTRPPTAHFTVHQPYLWRWKKTGKNVEVGLESVKDSFILYLDQTVPLRIELQWSIDSVIIPDLFQAKMSNSCWFMLQKCQIFVGSSFKTVPIFCSLFVISGSNWVYFGFYLLVEENNQFNWWGKGSLVAALMEIQDQGRPLWFHA